MSKVEKEREKQLEARVLEAMTQHLLPILGSGRGSGPSWMEKSGRAEAEGSV